MSSYSGISKPPDRAKAIAAVAAVHIALGVLIVAGLNVDKVRSAVEQLRTFDIREVPPRPNPPARQAPQPHQAPKPESAPAPKAQPAPVVAPQPKIPAPSPVAAASVAGTGSASNSGAANAGSGSGASGTGSGGGGDYSRFTPARLVSNIPSSEYRELAASGLPSGLVGVTIRVQPDGSVANCRIARSSGNGSLDSLVCQLTVRYVRFSPARDPQGRAVAQDITYFPNWRRR
jgi:protein TonB